MKISIWEEQLANKLRYIFRQNSYNEENCFGLNAYEELMRFDKELLTRFFNDKTQNISIRYREFYSLCHKYIRKYRSMHMYKLSYLIFSIWQNLRFEFKAEVYRMKLYNHSNFIRKATEYEYLIGTERFPEIEYEPNFYPILEYRGRSLFVDEKKELAYYINKDNSVKEFQLVWDWWYPMDEYFDLDEED